MISNESNTSKICACHPSAPELSQRHTFDGVLTSEEKGERNIQKSVQTVVAPLQ